MRETCWIYWRVSISGEFNKPDCIGVSHIVEARAPNSFMVNQFFSDLCVRVRGP